MEFDFLVKKIGLADEEIGTLRNWNDCIGPIGVSGVGDRLAAAVYPNRERRIPTGVEDMESLDRKRPDRC